MGLCGSRIQAQFDYHACQPQYTLVGLCGSRIQAQFDYHACQPVFTLVILLGLLGMRTCFFYGIGLFWEVGVCMHDGANKELLFAILNSYLMCSGS